MRNYLIAMIVCLSMLPFPSGADTPDSHKTALFDLKLFNGQREKGAEINSALRERIGKIKYLAIIKSGGGCASVKCAVNSGKSAGAHRAIYGTITVDTDIEKNRLGETGMDRYILKTERHYTYTIKVKIVDVETGGTIAVVSGKTGPDEMDAALDAISAGIASHYGPREKANMPELPVTEEKPEIAVMPSPEPVTEELKEEPKEEQVAEAPKEPEPAGIPEAVQEKEARPLSDYEAAAYFSFVLPTGDYADIASYAMGNIIEGRVKNLLLDGTEIRADIGFYYLAGNENPVKSYMSLFAAVFGGYRFNNILLEGLILTPLAGCGYQMHILENDNYSGTRTYFDPLVSLKCGADYPLAERISLAGAIGCSFFFEKDSIGIYPGLDLGVKYSF